MARDCPHALNFATSAARKLDYLNKKIKSNTVHMELANVHYQLDEEGTLVDNTNIFMNVLE